jgi:VWFA-related protein
MIRRRLPLLLLVSLAFFCLAGQELVLRTDVHSVEVSIVATDAKGKPAEGLRAADFRVFDNGKAQAIASFEKINSRAAPGQAGLPPNTYSNRIGGEKKPQVLSMILLDANNTAYRLQSVMLRAVEHILEQVQPEERVALYAFGSRFVTIHDFTSDTASLLARLRKYHGEVPDFAWAVVDPDLGSHDGAHLPGMLERVTAGKAVDTFEALVAIANRVKGVPGRKNLVWITQGVPMTVGDPQSHRASDARDPYKMAIHGAWRTFGVELGRAVTALNNAGVAVYPIDARGLSGSPSVNDNIHTMVQVASATGGKAFHDRNDREQGVRAALEDSREVYVLTYSPDNIAHDGAYHHIRVQSTRPGVRVRYRQGYFAPNGEETAVATLAENLTHTLDSPLDVAEIGIQASSKAGSGGADDVNIAVRVDLSDIGLAHDAARWKGALRLEAVQFGPLGEHYEGVTQAAQLDLLPETYRKTLAEGLKLEMKLQRNPAATAVRVAVADETSGRTGSVTIPLPARPAATR